MAAAKEPVTRDELFEALLASQELLAGTTTKRRRNRAARNTSPASSRTPGNPRSSARSACGCCGRIIPSSQRPAQGFVEQSTRGRCATRPGARWPCVPTTPRNRSCAAWRLTALNPALRAFAVLGLAHSASTSAESRRVLLALLADPGLRRDALRRCAVSPLSARRAPRSVRLVGRATRGERRTVGRTA